MKREPWFPLDANFQDDPDILPLSLAAEVAYFRSIGLGKRFKEAGRIVDAHLRRLTDKFDQLADQTGDIEARVARELVDAGLWTLVDGYYLIGAYESWNGAADRAAALSVEHGKFGAHQKHHVKKQFVDPGCKWCQGAPKPSDQTLPYPPSTHPTGTPPTPPRGGLQGDPTDPYLADETIQDETRSDLTSTVTSKKDNPQGVDERSGSTMAELLAICGYSKVEPTPGEIETAARVIARGWPMTHLRGIALEASEMDDPRSYLNAALETRANRSPSASASGQADNLHNGRVPVRPELSDEWPTVLAANEGWDDPDTVEAGLRAARAALTTRTEITE